MSEARICCRRGCSDVGVVKTGTGAQYCERHFRIRGMRSRARKSDKRVPTWFQAELMVNSCENVDGSLQCRRCGEPMKYRSVGNKKGAKGNVITLQHNYDQTMECCCHSCNTGHGSSKLGDAYWLLKDDEKYCPDCDEVKKTTDFHKSSGEKSGLHWRCKTCNNKQSREYRNRKKLLRN